MKFTPIFILLLIFAVVVYWLGVFVFARNRRKSGNQIFLVLSTAMTSWILASALADVLLNERAALWAARLAIVGPFVFSTFFYFFAYAFPSEQPVPRPMRWLGWTTLLITIIAFPTTLNIEKFTLQEWGADYSPGYLYTFLLLHFVIFVGGGIRQLRRTYKTVSGQARAQVRLVLVGIFSVLGIGVITNLLLPFAGYARASVFGPAGSLFFISFTTYAIVRHRLLDSRIALKKAFLQVAMSLTILLATLTVVFIAAALLDIPIQDFTLVYIGSLALAAALLFVNPLNQFFERLANRYFFTSLYNYQATLEELARQLTSVIDLKKVIDLIVGSIMQTMGLDRAGVLLLSGEKNSKRYAVAKVVGFNEQNGISLVRNNFLVQWLEQNRKLIVVEELSWLIEETVGSAERSQLMRLKTNMGKIEASMCLPLFSKDQLIGIIVLGNKVTGEAYTSEDLRLLQSIANQAAVAIQNAHLYGQVQEFNVTLEQKVREQTKDIAEKNQRLQDLIKMKSEFLSIASHQLRTPLTAIRGLLAMQADGDFDKLPKEEVKNEQKHMLDSANRLSNIVNDLLKAMELEGGNLNFAFEQIQLEDLLKSVIEDLQPNYDKKGLSLTLNVPNPPLPKVEAEPKMLHEVFMNIVDNAEKYTNKGGVTIVLKQKDEAITLTVKDTGIGIPKSDKDKLFQKFSRGEKSTYQHTNGSGLGLFIAKNVITEHHGTIDITSPGEGKGSTVTITLPLKQPKHSDS